MTSETPSVSTEISDKKDSVQTTEQKDSVKSESKADAKSTDSVSASVKLESKADAKSADSVSVTDSAKVTTVAKKPVVRTISKSAKRAAAKAAAEVIPASIVISAEAIQSLQMHDKDVGSSQVQIAKLTGRISHLTDHLRIHKKDNHTRRGLIALISRRRKLTAYLKRINLPAYRKVLSTLGLRK